MIKVLMLSITGLLASCENDEDNEPVDGNEQGSYTLSLSGGDVNSLEGVANYELDDGLLRIKMGGNPPDIVLNYSLGANEEIIPVGIYDPVSATGTGMPENSIAVQYNGTETYFGKSGEVEIIKSESGKIEGSIDAVLESIDGNSVNVEGSFTAIQ
jgi:hypothetical protein